MIDEIKHPELCEEYKGEKEFLGKEPELKWHEFEQRLGRNQKARYDFEAGSLEHIGLAPKAHKILDEQARAEKLWEAMLIARPIAYQELLRDSGLGVHGDQTNITVSERSKEIAQALLAEWEKGE